MVQPYTPEINEGDKQLAAQLLGISARTIYRKLGADKSETAQVFFETK